MNFPAVISSGLSLEPAVFNPETPGFLKNGVFFHGGGGGAVVETEFPSDIIPRPLTLRKDGAPGVSF